MIKNASSVALFKHFHFGENTLHENNTFHLRNIDSLLERSVQAGIFMIYVENIAIMIVGYTTFSSHQISFRLRYTLCSAILRQNTNLSHFPMLGQGEMETCTTAVVGHSFSPLFYSSISVNNQWAEDDENRTGCYALFYE